MGGGARARLRDSIVGMDVLTRATSSGSSRCIAATSSTRRSACTSSCGSAGAGYSGHSTPFQGFIVRAGAHPAAVDGRGANCAGCSCARRPRQQNRPVGGSVLAS